MITHVAHPTYPAFHLKIGGFTQSQIRKIAYVAAVPCRITRLLLSTVQCATANKRFCLWSVMGEELRMENASPTGTCRTGETRRTINQTIRRIYHCPDPHLPLLLNSSNHQSHLSHMSHSSHYSNSGAEHTPNSSIHPLTFRPFDRFFASLPPPLSKIIHRSSRYSRLPLPSIG